MNRIIKEQNAAAERLRRTAGPKAPSLSARDPVAFAAAVKVLG